MEEGDFEFVDEVYGGSIPKEFIGSVQKGFKSMMAKGRLIGFPVTGFRVVIDDGAAHAVDSSDNAFQAAARGAFRSVYSSAKPQILEPIMKVSVEGPLEFQGAFVRTIMQRRGIIIGTTEEEGFVRVDTEVPRAEMFGYATDLRSSSQGKAEYTMEFSRYAPVPAEVHQELVEKFGTGLVAEDEEEAVYREELNENNPLRLFAHSLHRGLGRGNIGVVVARHGIGKTAFLVGIALDDAMRGRKVLH